MPFWYWFWSIAFLVAACGGRNTQEKSMMNGKTLGEIMVPNYSQGVFEMDKIARDFVVRHVDDTEIEPACIELEEMIRHFQKVISMYLKKNLTQ